MSKYLLLLVLIPFIFLAGCTMLGQKCQQDPNADGCGGDFCKNPSGQAVGVIVDSFKSDTYPLSEIFSGESVSFSLTIQNNGEENAEEVKAKLYGLGTDWSGDVGVERDLGTLDKSQGDILGGVGDASWDVTSPSDLKGEMEYTATTRVTYKYKTTASGALLVYNDAWLDTQSPEERSRITSMSGISSFSATKAPVSIDLAALHPFRYQEGADNSKSVTVYIENIGQGYPLFNEIIGRVSIDKVEVNQQSCMDQSFPQEKKLPQPGSKTTIPCRFTLPEVQEFTTIPVDIELTYYYYTDACTNIKVIPSV